MDTITTPPTGFDPAMIAAKLNAITQVTETYRKILKGEIKNAELVVNVQLEGKMVRNHLIYPGEHFPIEFREFFETSIHALEADRLTIENNYSLLKVGNHVVQLDDFIKEYEPIPGEESKRSISEMDLILVRKLQEGQSTYIDINGEPTQVYRIS